MKRTEKFIGEQMGRCTMPEMQFDFDSLILGRHPSCHASKWNKARTAFIWCSIFLVLTGCSTIISDHASIKKLGTIGIVNELVRPLPIFFVPGSEEQIEKDIASSSIYYVFTDHFQRRYNRFPKTPPLKVIEKAVYTKSNFDLAATASQEGVDAVLIFRIWPKVGRAVVFVPGNLEQIYSLDIDVSLQRVGDSKILWKESFEVELKVTGQAYFEQSRATRVLTWRALGCKAANEIHRQFMNWGSYDDPDLNSCA